MHLIGFIIRIYHDARSPERQIKKCEELKLIPIYVSSIDISGEGDSHPSVRRVPIEFIQLLTTVRKGEYFNQLSEDRLL